MIDLEAIEARVKAATTVVFIGVPMRKENREFLEHAKDDVAALLAEVERLNAENEAMQSIARHAEELDEQLAAVTAERNAAVEDLRKNRARKCDCCAYAGMSERWPHVDCQSPICNYGDGWKWSGARKEQNGTGRSGENG